MKGALLICAALATTLARPDGNYHQQYQYSSSSSSFRNNELQHKNDDEGFFDEHGDLNGQTKPKINAYGQHTEYTNPNLPRNDNSAANDFYLQQTRGNSAGNDAQRLAYQANLGNSNGAVSSYSRHSGYSASSSFATGNVGSNSQQSNLLGQLQDNLSSRLENALQDLQRQQQQQQRYQTTYSAFDNAAYQRLQEELRNNLTLQLQNIQHNNNYYDSQEIDRLKNQLEDSLYRQLQTSYGHYQQNSQSSSSVSTNNYVPSNRQGNIYYAPTQLTPIPTNRNSNSAQVHTYVQSPRLPLNEVSREVENNLISKIERAINAKFIEYATSQSSYSSSSNYGRPHTVDFQSILNDLNEHLHDNITQQLQNELLKNYGMQEQRGSYFYSVASGNNNQNQPNYRIDELETLKQDLQNKLQSQLYEKFRQSYERQISYTPTPIVQPYTPLSTYRNFQTNQNSYQQVAPNTYVVMANVPMEIREITKNVQADLSHQVQLALQERDRKYRQQQQTGGNYYRQAEYNNDLQRLREEVIRNVTENLQTSLNNQRYATPQGQNSYWVITDGRYRSGSAPSQYNLQQYEQLRQELQDNLLTQLQSGMQQQASHSYASSSSSSNSYQYGATGMTSSGYRIPVGSKVSYGKWDDPDCNDTQAVNYRRKRHTENPKPRYSGYHTGYGQEQVDLSQQEDLTQQEVEDDFRLTLSENRPPAERLELGGQVQLNTDHLGVDLTQQTEDFFGNLGHKTDDLVGKIEIGNNGKQNYGQSQIDLSQDDLTQQTQDESDYHIIRGNSQITHRKPSTWTSGNYGQTQIDLASQIDDLTQQTEDVSSNHRIHENRGTLEANRRPSSGYYGQTQFGLSREVQAFTQSTVNGKNNLQKQEQQVNVHTQSQRPSNLNFGSVEQVETHVPKPLDDLAQKTENQKPPTYENYGQAQIDLSKQVDDFTQQVENGEIHNKHEIQANLERLNQKPTWISGSYGASQIEVTQGTQVNLNGKQENQNNLYLNQKPITWSLGSSEKPQIDLSKQVNDLTHSLSISNYHKQDNVRQQSTVANFENLGHAETNDDLRQKQETVGGLNANHKQSLWISGNIDQLRLNTSKNVDDLAGKLSEDYGQAQIDTSQQINDFKHKLNDLFISINSTTNNKNQHSNGGLETLNQNAATTSVIEGNLQSQVNLHRQVNDLTPQVEDEALHKNKHKLDSPLEIKPIYVSNNYGQEQVDDLTQKVEGLNHYYNHRVENNFEVTNQKPASSENSGQKQNDFSQISDLTQQVDIENYQRHRTESNFDVTNQKPFVSNFGHDGQEQVDLSAQSEFQQEEDGLSHLHNKQIQSNLEISQKPTTWTSSNVRQQQTDLSQLVSDLGLQVESHVEQSESDNKGTLEIVNQKPSISLNENNHQTQNSGQSVWISRDHNSFEQPDSNIRNYQANIEEPGKGDDLVQQVETDRLSSSFLNQFDINKQINNAYDKIFNTSHKVSTISDSARDKHIVDINNQDKVLIELPQLNSQSELSTDSQTTDILKKQEIDISQINNKQEGKNNESNNNGDANIDLSKQLEEESNKHDSLYLRRPGVQHGVTTQGGYSPNFPYEHHPHFNHHYPNHAQFDHHYPNHPHFDHHYPNHPHFDHHYPNHPHSDHHYPNHHHFDQHQYESHHHTPPNTQESHQQNYQHFQHQQHQGSHYDYHFQNNRNSHQTYEHSSFAKPLQNGNSHHTNGVQRPTYHYQTSADFNAQHNNNHQQSFSEHAFLPESSNTQQSADSHASRNQNQQTVVSDSSSQLTTQNKKDNSQDIEQTNSQLLETLNKFIQEEKYEKQNTYLTGSANTYSTGSAYGRRPATVENPREIEDIEVNNSHKINSGVKGTAHSSNRHNNEKLTDLQNTTSTNYGPQAMLNIYRNLVTLSETELRNQANLETSNQSPSSTTEEITTTIKPGFWNKVGGKITDFYENTKDKATSIIEKIGDSVGV